MKFGVSANDRLISDNRSSAPRDEDVIQRDRTTTQRNGNASVFREAASHSVWLAGS